MGGDVALLIGSHDDEHLRAVATALPSDQRRLVVDAGSIERQRYCLSGDHLQVEVGDERVTVELDRARGWIRRLAPPGWRSATVNGSRAGAERAAHLALVVGLAGHPGVAWLTPYRNLVASENKLRQDAHARRLEVAVPGTAVASDPDGIPPELGDDLVIKPLGPGHFTTDRGEARVVWAERMQRSDSRLHALHGAPFLVQEHIDAARHLRVVTCGERAWSCELDARDLPLDWRRDERAHHAFLPVDEPEVERNALRLAEELGVGYSSQDWIAAGEKMFFIDLNPAGQWLFLPEEVSGPITQAIADHLAK